jgi:uncharacterized protein
MQIEFDPNKDESNRFKHGLSLSLAASFNWETLWAWPDLRRPYFEERMVGFLGHEDEIYMLAFVDRQDVRRIISLRRANRREVMRYETERRSR